MVSCYQWGRVSQLCSRVQVAVFMRHNQKLSQSIDTSFMSFSPFYNGVEEKGKKQQIKERPWRSG